MPNFLDLLGGGQPSNVMSPEVIRRDEENARQRKAMYAQQGQQGQGKEMGIAEWRKWMEDNPEPSYWSKMANAAGNLFQQQNQAPVMSVNPLLDAIVRR